MVEFTVFKGSKEGKIVKSTTKKELKADEVLIKTTHSGLCGTDEHYRHADQGLGHEGAGVVEVRLLSSYRVHQNSNNPLGSRCFRKDIKEGRFRRMGISTQQLRALQTMPDRPRDTLR